MKRFFNVLIFIIFSSKIILAQTPVIYTGVIQAESNSDRDLYLKGLQWMALTFKSANDVIQFKDQESKVIIGRGTIRYEPRVFLSSSCTRGYIDYTIKLEFKTGRFKYTITDFIHRGASIGCQGESYRFGLIMNETPCNGNYYPPARAPKGWMNNLCEDMKNNISETSDRLIKSLTTELPNISVNNSDDW